LKTNDLQAFIFTAQRYASAVLAIALCLSVCLSVCLSQVGVVSKRMNESTWVFWHKSFLRLILHRVLRKFGYLQNNGTLSKTLDFENFATASQSCSQQNSSTVELVDHTYDGRRVGGSTHTLLHVGCCGFVVGPTTCSYSCVSVPSMGVRTYGKMGSADPSGKWMKN